MDVSTKKTFARGTQVRNTKMAAFPVYGETTSNTLVNPYKTSISISEKFALRLHSLCMLQGGAEDFFFSGSFFYIPPQGPYKFSEPPKQSAEKLIPPPPPSPLPRNIKINICIIVNYICLKSQETCLIRTSREL